MATRLPPRRRIRLNMPEVSHPPGPEETVVGSYFVANYPPFSVWTRTAVDDAEAALQAAATRRAAGPLRAHPLLPEALSLLLLPGLHRQERAPGRGVSEPGDDRVGTLPGGRRPLPAARCTSSISGAGRRRSCRRSSCERLVARTESRADWSRAAEVTFECEPGTLSDAKLGVLREIGVTRLSLGVENFDDRILELNGRAHRSPEIYRVFQHARRLDFPQINIDLIAGMIGESDANWRACHRSDDRAVARQRDDLPDGAALTTRRSAATF